MELNDNYISDDEENENICFDEVKPLFEKCIENIEIIPEEKRENPTSNTNQINYNINAINHLTSEEINSNDSYIIWTYNTGCSEHITNNKNILKNCKISKLKRLPHNGIPPTASGILETIHSDLIGPMGITSGTGKKFILIFIDEFSRKSWIFLLKRKRDVPNTTIQFFKTISNRFNCNIKFFKTDNGLEFKNKKIEKYCLNNGITIL